MQYTVLVCTFVKELGRSISLIYHSLNSIKFSETRDTSHVTSLSLLVPTFSEVVTTFSQRHTIPVTSVPGARHSTILGILPVASGIWNNREQVSLMSG